METQDMKVKEEWFRRMAVPSFLYSIFFTLCKYENWSGILIPIWAIGTIVYVNLMFKRAGVSKKRGSLFFCMMIFLFGFSTFLTGNIKIIVFDYFGFFGMLVLLVLYQVSDGRSWGFLRYFEEAFEIIGGALGSLPAPFEDGGIWMKQHKTEKNKTMRQVLLGLAAAVPCVLFLALLLASADAVFRNVFRSFFDHVNILKMFMKVLFLLVIGFLASYCGMRFALSSYKTKERMPQEKKSPTAVITVLGVILALYAWFCGIQIVYLFTGFGQLPEGVTYASYARQGFFQLLFVCVLNIAVVLTLKRMIIKSRILDGLLLAVCVCTYIMTASSAYRMLLYIGAYHLTFLRVLVLVALGTIAVLLLFVLVYIIKESFPVVTCSFVLVCVVAAMFSLSHVDYFIADYNLRQVDQSEKVIKKIEIMEYVSTLSTDAAPAIGHFIENSPELEKTIEMRMEQVKDGKVGITMESRMADWYLDYLKEVSGRLDKQSLRTFNLSSAAAKKVLPLQEKFEKSY